MTNQRLSLRLSRLLAYGVLGLNGLNVAASFVHAAHGPATLWTYIVGVGLIVVGCAICILLLWNIVLLERRVRRDPTFPSYSPRRLLPYLAGEAVLAVLVIGQWISFYIGVRA